MNPSRFQAQSPKRVLKQAERFRQSIPQVFQLPVNPNKSMYVEHVANSNRSDIEYAIDRAKYQNSIYKKLEKQDEFKRKQVSKSLLLKSDKVEQNHTKYFQKFGKEHEKYNKHLDEVHKRYSQQERKKFMSQKQQAEKLRNQLKQFYRKEQLRKKAKDQSQVSVKGCYQNALQRINKIQRKNQQFAKQSEQQLEVMLARNGNKSAIIQQKMRSTSFGNQKKNNIFQNSLNIFLQKEQKYVQVNAFNEEHYLKAVSKKSEDSQKVKKRINQFFKKRVQKWKQQKKRVDQQNSQVPEKCLKIIDHTTKASFRKTVSSFRDSFSQWENKVIQNKSNIKDHDQKKKDQIMSIHYDLRLRNKSSFKVNEQMGSMRSRARKVAQAYSVIA